MPLDPAPYFAEVAHGPSGGAAYWIRATDGPRLRVGYWPVPAARGTVLIFPGRTEFIEKYGQIAKALADRGFASLAIDWRGQGLADRLLDNPMVGHVDRFTDYQNDIQAMLQAAGTLNVPRPLFLLAHSMGGAIGLRAAMEGLEVKAVVFSGPMWSIKIAPHLKPAAWFLSHTMPTIGHGHRLPPGTRLEHHVLVDGFEGNLLTRDRAQFDIMYQQLVNHPELALGGPSFVWLREALRETHRLARCPAPALPCLTYVGSHERIVGLHAIEERMRRWPGGRLDIVPDAEHEVMMESATVTAPIFDDMASLFLENA